MSTSDSAPSSPAVELDRARLAAALEGAKALLYYAVEAGKAIQAEVRDPIVKLSSTGSAPISAAEESAFLEAYARLAASTTPVTASTLRATSRHRGPWWAKLLHIERVSEAQTFSFYFGLVALVFLFAIGVGEWTRTFIANVVSAQEEAVKIQDEKATLAVSLEGIKEELKALPSPPPSGRWSAASVCRFSTARSAPPPTSSGRSMARW